MVPDLSGGGWKWPVAGSGWAEVRRQAERRESARAKLRSRQRAS